MDQLQETLELDPKNPRSLSILAMAYAGKGMSDKAISIFQGIRNIPFFYLARLGYIYGKAGKIEEAQKILDDFLDQSEREYFSPYLISIVYSGLGASDKVFEWLDRAYGVQDPNQYILKVDFAFGGLHSDPRWTEQMKKRGLAD